MLSLVSKMTESDDVFLLPKLRDHPRRLRDVGKRDNASRPNRGSQQLAPHREEDGVATDHMTRRLGVKESTDAPATTPCDDGVTDTFSRTRTGTCI